MHAYRIASPSFLPLHPFMQQRTPSDLQSKGSASSCGTIQRHRPRVTSRSTGSQGSFSSNRLRVRNENIPSSRSSSHSSLQTTSAPVCTPSPRATPSHIPRTSSWVNESPLLARVQGAPSLLSDVGPLEDVDLTSLNRMEEEGLQVGQDHGLSFEMKHEKVLSTPRHLSGTSQDYGPAKNFHATTDHPFSTGRPFRKWVGSLRRQRHARRRTLTAREERWTLDDFDSDGQPFKTTPQQMAGRDGHQKSSSWSPFGLLTSVKSATASIVPPHPEPRSRVTRRPHILRPNRSSRLSSSQNDMLESEAQRSALPNDQEARVRAVQRRGILEELMSSEESYVADLKVLLHVYVFILESAPKIAQGSQPGVSRNVRGMLLLHEELLLEIKMLMSMSADWPANSSRPQKRFEHSRWHSIDTLEGVMGEKATSAIRRSLDVPWLVRFKHPTSATFPKEAADIAKLFERMLPRFFLYEEYGAQYESMLQNMASLSRTMPTWSAYERGIESLVNSLIPQNGAISGSKKGLTLEDLLIKPIQRVCKYPLLFAELYKYTPAMDGPEATAKVERTYHRLREMANEINKATNDVQTQNKIQRSWRLQDLLAFPQAFPASFPLRQLGHAALCGVLYVAYQSTDGVLGNYMFCALFKSHLLLAVSGAGNVAFQVVAIINLNDLQMNKADNGKGLQCHTAPFSWKIMFESDQHLYELILCACTAREEQQWKADLLAHTAKDIGQGSCRPSPFSLQSLENSILCLDIKTLGPVFGLPGTLMRRQSIQRAVTVNSRKSASQVMIKNTYSLKENNDSPVKMSGNLTRSKSLMSGNQIPLLAPRRGDRQRMEQKMSEVWTKDRLPFPGMTGYRGGHLIRTSANSVMRKLSMASNNTTISLAGSVKQRTVTYGSVAERNPFTGDFADSRANQTDGASSPTCANIHSYPKTFWSTFEYHEPRTVSQPALLVPNGEDITCVTKVRIDSLGNREGKRRRRSEASTIVALRESTEIRKETVKSHNGSRLLKAFSTGGMRSLFRH